MKKYMHYGIEVVYQTTDRSFKQYLKDNNIEYIDLPIIENVIKYDKNGISKYACIVECGIEDYEERIYITEQVPLDMNWQNLINDIDSQINGEDPARMETKAHMLCRLVEDIIWKSGNDDFSLDDMSAQDEIDPLDFRLTLRTLGYEVEELLEMDCSDVDTEELERMKN